MNSARWGLVLAPALLLLGALATRPRCPFLGHRSIPVLHDLRADRCAELSALLRELGVEVCSVSLRHSGALDALAMLAGAPGAPLVGVSTAVSEVQVRQAAERGAAFASTTFTTRTLVEACRSAGLPLLAGVASEDDAELAISCGAAALKFYPASQVPPQQLQGALLSLAARHGRLPPVFIAGGVRENQRAAYLTAGADGFALGVDCRQSADGVAEGLRRALSFASL